MGDTFYIDEVFVKINGKQHNLWRAVDRVRLPREAFRLKAPTFGKYGEVVDVYLQATRDGPAAKCFFMRFLRESVGEPRKIVTNKLRSYGVGHRELMPEAIHSAKQYENNRAEQSLSLPRFMGTKRPGCER